MWGVGNEVENQGQDSMLKILKMLKEHLVTLNVKSLNLQSG
nr:hypothetical protein [Paenibacillus sp. RC67]